MSRRLALTVAFLSAGLATAGAWAQESEPPKSQPPMLQPPPPPDHRTIDRQIRDLEDRMEEHQRNLSEHRRLFNPPEILPNSAWLGIQLSPVPAALAYHLNLENKGVMVANVFEGSPAEKTGLERFDVIVSTDGKPVTGGPDAVRNFSDALRDKRPGQAVELSLLSHGREKNIRVDLADPPHDPFTMRPKYAEDPDVAFHRDFAMRGKIMRPGPQGGWVMEDLDKFPGFRNRLERDFPLGMGGFGGPPGQGKRTTEARRVDETGALQVNRNENGRITVRRSKPGQDLDESRTFYDNMDQLREADREAYDLLEAATPRAPFCPPAFGGPYRPGQPSVPTPFDPEPGPLAPPPGPNAGPIPPLGPYAPEDARDPEKKWQEWQRHFFRGPLKDLKDRQAALPPPKITFDVATDGKITVHLRNQDTEMNRTFNSPDELRDKAPDLYKQYQRLEDQMKAPADVE